MKVITIGNEKGGVGKTTTAVNLSSWLAARGRRVLLIDIDAQGNATRGLDQQKSAGIYDLLARRMAWQSILIPIPREVFTMKGKETHAGELFLVPSNVETRNIAETISDVFRLKKRLNEVRTIFDVVIIDTSPTPSLLDSMVYMATDYVIYPTKCEEWSLEGLDDTIEHVVEASEVQQKQVGGEIQHMMILPTMFRGNTVGHTYALEKLQERYGDLVFEPIHERTAWVDAAFLKEPIYVFEPSGNAKHEFEPVVDTVERMLG